ncbi:MAG: hypothetical protein N2235_08010 [Fischerella sp.]|nr:hypothetical protein [Fischerella sp.]
MNEFFSLFAAISLNNPLQRSDRFLSLFRTYCLPELCDRPI